MQLIGDEQREVSQAWLEKVYADAGVKWEKSAEQRSARSRRSAAQRRRVASAEPFATEPDEPTA